MPVSSIYQVPILDAHFLLFTTVISVSISTESSYVAMLCVCWNFAAKIRPKFTPSALLQLDNTINHLPTAPSPDMFTGTATVNSTPTGQLPNQSQKKVGVIKAELENGMAV